MQVILLEKMQGLGELGEEVHVKPGFARNFLIPKGKAVAATAENRAGFESRRAELERRQAQAVDNAEARAAALEGTTLTIARKAGSGGRLFGSVGTADVAEAIGNAGVAVQRSEVRLAAAPIRQIGEYEVFVRLHSEVEAKLNLVVEAEG